MNTDRTGYGSPVDNGYATKARSKKQKNEITKKEEGNAGRAKRTVVWATQQQCSGYSDDDSMKSGMFG